MLGLCAGEPQAECRDVGGFYSEPVTAPGRNVSRKLNIEDGLVIYPQETTGVDDSNIVKEVWRAERCKKCAKGIVPKVEHDRQLSWTPTGGSLPPLASNYQGSRRIDDFTMRDTGLIS